MIHDLQSPNPPNLHSSAGSQERSCLAEQGESQEEGRKLLI